jgi:FkbM family methyltransferase
MALFPPGLSTRARWSFVAHLLKAVTQQHHRELVPVLRPFVPPDAVVLDVGGHAGQFAKLLARLAPEGRVYSFEPGNYARTILERAIRLNRLRNVEIVPRALGSAPGWVTLSVPIKRSGSMGFGLGHLGAGDPARAAAVETVEVDTIDAFARARGLARLDFVKADIEGWELEMLRGGADTLRRFGPVLFLEVDDQRLARAGDSGEALAGFLGTLGYRPFVQAGNGIAPASSEDRGDLFWLPAERG